jgi:hypothetical protein
VNVRIILNGRYKKMTKEEKQTLYENVCNDISCGTFILLPQYVDELIAKYTKVYRRKLMRIKRAVRKID